MATAELNDIDQLRDENSSLRNQVEELRTYSERLQEIIRDLKRSRFGKKSERWESKEQLVFNEAEVLAKSDKPDEDDPSEGEGEITVREHKKARGKRKPLPKELPREIVKIELSESERIGANGKPLRPIGEEISEKLHFEPAKLKVLEIHRVRYGEDSGDTGIIAPPPPSIIPKSYLTESLLAYIIVQKYCYGLPFYRMEEMFEKLGAEVPRCTQARWVIAAAQASRGVWNILEERLMASPYVQADETWVQVLKEKERRPETKSWMWVRATPSEETKIILFNYDPNRTQGVCKRLFEDYHGRVQSDGYQGYGNIPTRIGCNMHSRRKFESAFKIGSKSGRGLAEEGLKFYKKLYDLEEKWRDIPFDQRKLARDKEATPIWEEMKSWSDKNKPKVPPQSKLGEAFTYFDNQYQYLRGYLSDGRYEMDNGFVERAIKNFAIGRKNWLFSDSVAGAEASELFYSFVVTAKINGQDPHTALKTMFERLPYARTAEDLEALADLIAPRQVVH